MIKIRPFILAVEEIIYDITYGLHYGKIYGSYRCQV